MIHTKPEMVILAVNTAEKHGLDPAFICALIESETHWNPAMVEWSPAPGQKPFSPWTDDIDRYMRDQHRYGLLQVQGTEPGNLTNPQTNLEVGCKLFAELLQQVNGDYSQAARLWWGMKEPPKLTRIWKLVTAYRTFLESRQDYEK